MKDKKPLERWHGAHHYSSKVHLALVLVLFLTMGILIWSYIELNDIQILVQKKASVPTPTPQIFCTMEAKLCPDGSYVARQGPNCEFAQCPSN